MYLIELDFTFQNKNYFIDWGFGTKFTFKILNNKKLMKFKDQNSFSF
jgi:hypothetical protein